jgi:cytochrome o ubiquinol oxidase subunit 1
MGYMHMPVFCLLVRHQLLIVAAFPILTATFAMLLLDRYLDFHFFTVADQGNRMMYVNLFWGGVTGGLHPDPAGIRHLFGGHATFSTKPVFGYRSMVTATLAIAFSLSCLAAPFLTMGASADVNGFFGVMNDHRGSDRSTGCSRCTGGECGSQCRSCGRSVS